MTDDSTAATAPDTREDPAAEPAGTPATPVDTALVEEINEALKDVIDPELGVNVVDLGLLYGVNVDSGIITLDMTLTSAACPLTDVIEDQATSALDEFDREVKINWVWMPPWGPDKITDDGRDQLRMLGFNV
ncbi:metal-sulfur cluster assembly factor [Nocardiopsis sediminis]|uniref:Metal-sulfur cluster assembly factor n=1 Tax=Nocardiopsis sediminis TaxID=1778267 RepID=A0ABV8FGK1_9ACTN